jgi:ubiquinone/menaquinone biosynthesis C-methylase UbiE
MRNVISWLSDEELNKIYTSEYWNDIEEEKKKEWWIEDGNYEKCKNYLQTSSLLHEYEMSEVFITNFKRENIKIADLASGIGWTSALISKIKNVEEVHSVEISKHRIHSLFEHSIKMLSGDSAKIWRYLGSFYDLKFDNNSLDIIYMSQAFHHSDAPLKLLHECDRVLKEDGRIILVGEHYIGIKKIIKGFLRNTLKKRKPDFNFYNIFEPDPILGDHYYRVSDYQFMFNSMGYTLHYQKLSNGNVIYVADKIKS